MSRNVFQIIIIIFKVNGPENHLVFNGRQHATLNGKLAYFVLL